MYLQPGRQDLGGLRHLVFTDIVQYTNQELSLYLAEHDRGGRPLRWLFDTFVVSARPRSGNCLGADVNIGTTMSGEGDFFAWPSPQPTTLTDWTEVLETNFAPDGPLALLESSAAALAREIGPPPRPLNVILYHPYPSPRQPLFGRLDGRRLNFTVLGQTLDLASRRRLDACCFFTGEAARRWDATAFPHLNFLGFYWPHETIYRGWDVDDHWVLKELKKHVNAAGLKMFWVPFWCSWNVALLSEYSLWFDAAWLQPNYMFYEAIGGVGEAAEAARARGAGIEMEFYISQGADTFSPRVRAERLVRFRSYLDGGVQFGYMSESALAWYLGDKALAHLWQTGEEADFALYRDICAFIHGEYGK
ncbi:MAG: hypothetical protein Kow0059_08680 [Candidatus Sumerlaeia bacterium]